MSEKSKHDAGITVKMWFKPHLSLFFSCLFILFFQLYHYFGLTAHTNFSTPDTDCSVSFLSKNPLVVSGTIFHLPLTGTTFPSETVAAIDQVLDEDFDDDTVSTPGDVNKESVTTSVPARGYVSTLRFSPPYPIRVPLFILYHSWKSYLS